MNSRFFSFATCCTASPTDDTGTSRITSTWPTSYHRRAMPAPISGLSWWLPTITLIGLPKTLPPKSSTAICAAVTEPWPVGVDPGPLMSVSTPSLTTSSETCASAAVEASIASVSAASMGKCLLSILSPPVAFDRPETAHVLQVLRDHEHHPVYGEHCGKDRSRRATA